MRLIDADALYKKLAFNSNGERIPDVDCDNFPITVNIASIKRMILNAPTIDAEPVTRGKWEDKYHALNYKEMKITGTYPTCNLCGHVSAGGFLTRTNYCPNCGAKMEGKL